MPIYAYRCTTCGHAKDMLMKVGAAGPTTCPACGAATFVKQVTAAGFQLKGSGWYVTDFRGGNSGAAKNDATPDGAADKPASKSDEAAPAKAEAAPAAEPAGERKSTGSAEPAAKPATKAASATDKA